ncbi:50S ribosomal protein L10 [Candidatus Poribacteria bacterium]|nr:50S ribosomal protein L10 [Candidatus Poribacteria bacterium]
MKRNQKETQIKEIQEKLSDANATVVTTYKGLTVEKISTLRRDLRKSGAEYKVYKNTLSNRAYNSCGFNDVEKYFSGSTAIAFVKKDPAAVAKVLNEFKKNEELFGIKFGTLGNKIVSVEEIKILASLPSREVLIAKVLGGMKAPISGLACVLSGTIAKLGYVLKNIAEQKEKAVLST